MNILAQIWLAALLAVPAYFLFKSFRAKKNAWTRNDFAFTIWTFFKNDWIDVATGFVLVLAYMLFGDKVNEIPLVGAYMPKAKIVDPYTAFAFGWGIASIAVDVLLDRVGLGNKSRKENLEVVDAKTNIADYGKKE